jgi:hypothetical protein
MSLEEGQLTTASVGPLARSSDAGSSYLHFPRRRGPRDARHDLTRMLPVAGDLTSLLIMLSSWPSGSRGRTVRERTLVTQRLYFGIDALNLRTAANRVLARVVGLPPEFARVSARNIRQDFALDTVEGETLVEGLVAEGLLEPRPERHGDYRLTERFLEFATARVVDPLPRHRAKELVARACELAARINAEWTKNPLEIEEVVPFGSYMSRNPDLAVLDLGLVVRPRGPSRRTRWGRIASKPDGAREVRNEFRALSSFIRVRMVNDRRLLPRPFTVSFQDR